MYPLSVRYVNNQAEKSLKSIPVTKARELLDDIGS